ncbi:glutathione S-transferase [Antarcticimicrobium sediminis]|uniref:Glutathione S-transferase n=1 Tax=Antarcticimicrobium sediminis TaxID=2546227 RepID=A0A4R5EQX7_9RHOB|nr:glutathione S-transferase [Antarcticimicrobium sediminis]TDE37087.1 glutathione S-transferase [Antarcticimicrobium sediminis]
MKLIMSPASPFVRKVAVLILETGQQGDIEQVEVATTPVNTAEAVWAANPLGKIPALVLEDGRALYDSRVITRFLDDRVKAGLYPEDRLWDVLTLEATADGILEAAVLMVYEGRVRPPELRSDLWVEAQWTKAMTALKAVNDRWLAQLEGPLDIAQIAMGCALGYLDFRHSDRDWRKGNAALAEWYARFEARPAMVATRPPV